MDIHKRLRRWGVDVELWAEYAVLALAPALIGACRISGVEWWMVLVYLSAMCASTYALWIAFLFVEHIMVIAKRKYEIRWTGGIWGPRAWQAYILALCQFILVWYVLWGGKE